MCILLARNSWRIICQTSKQVASLQGLGAVARRLPPFGGHTKGTTMPDVPITYVPGAPWRLLFKPAVQGGVWSGLLGFPPVENGICSRRDAQVLARASSYR